jgi:nitrous oxidase accessory protein NosD
MKRTALALTLILALLFSAIAPFHFFKTVSADTLIVPDDYSTIQKAINAANNGDLLFIKEGIYSENITINKAISLKGENPGLSILKGQIKITAGNVEVDSITIDGSVWYQQVFWISGVDVLVDTHEMSAVTIRNCIFKGWTCAACVGGRENRIISNTFSNVDIAIEVTGSDNIISYNDITANYGVSVSGQYLSNNLIFRNKISAEVGIVISRENTNNYIFENTIIECGIGLYLGVYPEGFGPCSNNKFYHNNLIDNAQQVFVAEGSANIWDNGYPDGGNYWSSYNERDMACGENQANPGSDGIGDLPVVIDSTNKDAYPLMNPFRTLEGGFELIDFAKSFRDFDGKILYTNPSSFRLTFPNGTTSPPLQIGQYQLPTGSSILYSVIWQGTEIKPTKPFIFDSINGNPQVNCSVYSLTIDPTFYDKNGYTVKPSFWTIKFPNGTEKIVSSKITFNQTQTGEYKIVNIFYAGVNIEADMMVRLDSHKVWTPEQTAYIPPVLVYNIESNSVITESYFNETSKAISFVVSGPDGTSGYAIVRIEKMLANQSEDITVYFDYIPIDYSIDSDDYAWIVSINYTHSSHKIVINLAKQAQPQESFSTILAVSTIASVAFVGVGLIVYFKKRKKESSGNI